MIEEIDADLHHFTDIHPSLTSFSQSEYYLRDNFNDLCTSDGLKLIHCNIRPLLPKMEEITD